MASVAAVLAFATPVASAGETTPVWQGPYVGLGVGGVYGHSTWTTTSVGKRGTGVAKVLDASSPATFDSLGGRLSAMAGYDWAFGPWVVGGEIQLGLGHAHKRIPGLPGCAIRCSDGATTAPGADSSIVTLGWDGAARLKAGFLVTPGILVYATAGAVLQDLKVSATCQHSSPDPFCANLPGTPFESPARHGQRLGPTIGAGLEARIAGPWFLRLSYDYATTARLTSAFTYAVLPGRIPGTLASEIAPQTHTAMVTLVYRFASP